MTETDQDQSKVITAVQRAADVLLLFAQVESRTLGVTEIANDLGLSKAVVHRILTSLRGRGFVELERETRRYALGPSALALGMRYMDHVDLRELARDSMRRIVDRTDETATLSVRTGWTRVYLDQITPNREVKMTVQLGQAFPLHAGSSSKAFLAFMTKEEIDEYLERDLEPLTDATIVDRDELREELRRIRERGYATSHGERQAYAASVAAPILDHEGLPAAVMSVCGPVERFGESMSDVAGVLLEETTALSERLGYREAKE